ncbi:MAG: hypothetical protein JNL87_01335 [Burkholderiaceae bacterium]|nr:hypothetical protein [Burkholderiaceae bacterium]
MLPIAGTELHCDDFNVPRPPQAAADEELLPKVTAVAVQLAIVTAFALYEKKCRKKGRKPSDKAQLVWAKTKLPAQRSELFLQAARATREHAADPERHMLHILRHLRSEYEKACRSRGRPRIVQRVPSAGGGMLKSLQLPSPAAPTPESELRKFNGLKLRGYVKSRGLAETIDLDAALAHLQREAYNVLGQRTPEAVTGALNQFVSDRVVARMAKAEALFGATGDSLAKRIQRARKKRPVLLPMGGI